MDSKTSLKDQRDATLRSLRHNTTQATSWQLQLVGLLEELNRDNLKLRQGFGMLTREISELKQERIAIE